MNRVLAWLRRTVTPTNPHQAAIDKGIARIETQQLELDRAIEDLIKVRKALNK